MIIVTGTKRSGTSMWMQILVAGGFPHIGEPFPQGSRGSLEQANVDGFYESRLVIGINFRTNPDPESGDYLFAAQTRSHAVKVFIPGVVRTDIAFMDRTIATVRNWREFGASMRRLHSLTGQADTAEEVAMDPVLEWWTQNFALIRDIATRRYAAHVLSYGSLLADPEANVREIFAWLGAGDVDAAARAVKPGRQTKSVVELGEPELPDGIDRGHVEVFDELYHRIDEGKDLEPSFVQRLNETDIALRPLVVEHHARVRAATARRMLDAETHLVPERG